jgi:hypothetical protein
MQVGERAEHALEVHGDPAAGVEVAGVDADSHPALREDARPWRG